VLNSGLSFLLIQASSKAFMATDFGQAAMEGGGNPLSSLQQFGRMVSTGILQAGADGLTACQDADMVIYSPVGGYIATHIAEKLDVPAIGAIFQPLHPTRAFPSYASPTQRNLGGFLNRLTYLASDTMFWVPYRSAVNQFRQEQLNLPQIPVWVNEIRHWHRRSPVICGFSPSVVQKPPDWGDHVEITGYWFLDRQPGWQPPADLADFLAAGAPPVYIGFGSMSTRKPQETTELVLGALSRDRQRGLLLTGWGGLSEIELPDYVFKIESAPHDWLFPQMAAVVHHGGAGTTAAGLQAGIPTIIVPHFIDQPFWGQRVADLGAGPQPIPRRQLTAERLADAITMAVTDEKMRRRATELGEIIRAEDGVARAVEVINSHISVQKP
jgi:UDP:flavonoid glycosyltransferase YjiC (YdhE family)